MFVLSVVSTCIFPHVLRDPCAWSGGLRALSAEGSPA